MQVRIPESSAIGSVLLFGSVALVLLFAKVLLIPLAFALTLSFLLMPVVDGLERRGMRRTFSVAVAGTLTFCLILGATYILSRQLLHVAGTLPSYSENIHRKIAALHTSSAGSLQAAVVMMEDMSGDLAAKPAPGDALRVQVVGPRSEQLRATVGMIGEVLEPIGQIGIVFIFTMYMLANREELRHRLLLMAGMGNLNVMTRALEDAASRISQYLVMQFQVNAGYGFLFGVGLHFLGVPEATLWGVIAGTLRIVPFLGPLMGLVLPLLLSVAVSVGWWHPVLVLGLFLVLETTVGNVVEPLLFSSRTGISSLALLASAIFWSMIWGWPGLVLATPLTVCVVVMARYVPQFSFLHKMLGATAKLPPAAHLYERLLALDQVEALAIAERYLDGKPLAELYDSVIIPVLSLAEEDRHKGALTEVQVKFVMLSVGELLARLNGRPVLGEVRENRGRRKKEFAVVCVSADGGIHMLPSVMLSQLLEQAGHQTVILSTDAVSDEILAGLGEEKDTVIIISALPPFAVAQTKALCQRVRVHLPENRIAVAHWNSDEDMEEMATHFGLGRPDVLVAKLGDAVRQVGAWEHEMQRS